MTYRKIDPDEHYLYFFYFTKAELKLNKKEKTITVASNGVGSRFLGNVSDFNDFSSSVLWD